MGLPKSPNTPPGPTPFGVKVVSGEDPGGSAVEEGVLTVGRFDDRNVEIYPVTQRGRRKGEFEIAVDNRGNAPSRSSSPGPIRRTRAGMRSPRGP